MNKFVFVLLLSTKLLYTQEVTFFKQFNGRYDFLMIGNTLNESENPSNCTILTSSSANLQLGASQNIIAAYLYWAGSGTGDFDIQLNNMPITAERTFSYTLTTAFAGVQPFFAAFSDITNIISNSGNGSYTISELDLTTTILTNNYCENKTNFGGWGILIIYEDNTLPLNQISVFDGLQAVSRVQQDLTLVLDNLNVLDNNNAKIGFITWEGDQALALNETLRINGSIISNPPLNPANNAFNGTNSFTNSNLLYNMDLDFYNVENNIQIGDTQATIQLTSGADLVMINTIVTKFNSQLPDATIVLDNYQQVCSLNDVVLNFTVFNTNSTKPLPANTSIGIYTDGTLIATAMTQNEIPINGQESQQITISIPNSIPTNFTLALVVDYDLQVSETNENNNTFTTLMTLITIPNPIAIQNLKTCNLGFNKGTFNLQNTYQFVVDNLPSNFQTTFYTSLEDAYNQTNEIDILQDYTNEENPETIYVKTTNPLGCIDINTFQLIVYNCPPFIPNTFTPNNDTINDTFFIEGLQDIFLNYHLEIYNRWGSLVYKGNNAIDNWDGTFKNKKLPSSTYYYILDLNDNNYKPFVGWVYLLR